MPEPSIPGSGVLSEISQHLEGIFRHMLPGALVTGAARLAQPTWFAWVDLKCWQHLLLLSVIAIVAGNAWFALNRYGLHQFVDYLFYLLGFNGPARPSRQWSHFLDDLGKYTCRSLHTTKAEPRAIKHVAFRASAVLLILTIGELAVLLGFWHDNNPSGSAKTFLDNHRIVFIIGGLITFVFGIWQEGITRRIDYYIVTYGKDLPND